MTDENTTQKIPTGGWEVAKAQGAGWLIAAITLYGCYVMGQAIVKDGQLQLERITQAFSQDLKHIAETNLSAAKTREQAIELILQTFREDEAEDRRLFVEILRRSDMSAQDIREAIETAGAAPTKLDDR